MESVRLHGTVTFWVAGPEEGYMLRNLGNFSGSAGDSLTNYDLGMKFSTFDNDNDLYGGNCAVLMELGGTRVVLTGLA